MKSAVWISEAADPLHSGELRRIGVPAMLLEDVGWSCQFLPASLAHTCEPATIAIIPLTALHIVPRIAHRVDKVIVTVHDGLFEEGAPDPEPLIAFANRIAGVVAYSRRTSAWSQRCLGKTVPIWTMGEPAIRDHELLASAIRFGFPVPDEILPVLPPAFELWFAEPGDRIDSEEGEQLVSEWMARDVMRVVVAPRRKRLWLKQLGLDFIGLDWSASTLQMALESAQKCIFTGNAIPGRARRRALALRSGANAPPMRQRLLSAHDPSQVAAKWHAMLKEVIDNKFAPDFGDVMIVLDLVQDLDLVMPVILGLQQKKQSIRVIVSGWLAKRSPRVGIELARHGIITEVIARDMMQVGEKPDFENVVAVISPAESSLSAHRRIHSLFKRARGKNIPTFSFQHGLENIGLSEIMNAESPDISIVSDHLLVWFGEKTASDASSALQPRLAHIGRFRSPAQSAGDLLSALDGFDETIAIFENLHWDRYSRQWRTRFIEDCISFASERPESAIILKPHHAGLWSLKNAHLFSDWPNNLILADPTEPTWEPFTAPALLQLANMVITTPSTVALDAAEAGLPVAVAAYGLNLTDYMPLPLLQSLSDWRVFAAGRNSPALARSRSLFIDRHTTGDDPTQACLDYITRAIKTHPFRSIAQAEASP